jgi:serine phosphatase RsbU (regulator of sigma subunit)
MIRTIVLAETVVLAALVWWCVRGARPRAASGGRLTAIAALVAAQALLLDAFTLRLLPALGATVSEGARGALWLAQAARAALLVWALALWYGVSREDLASRGRSALMVVALLAVGLTANSIPVLGVAALVWVTGRPRWTRELSGRRRGVIALAGPLLLALTSVWPRAVVGEGAFDHRWVAITEPWQASLVEGAVATPLALELALARPLDRLVQALLDLFRAQLLVLSLRAITLPIRLHGMSLRRRFTLHYLFVRSVPSVLATITVLLVGYVAFGVHLAGRARDALERTLVRADAAGAALLSDPRAARGGPGTVALLETARGWLGSDSARAHLALRGREPGAGEVWLATSPGIPVALPALAWPGARAGTRRGVLEADSALYLFARRTDRAESTRAIEVFVRLDSAAVAGLARAIGAAVSLSVDRGVLAERGGLRFPEDLLSRDTPILTSHGRGPARERRLFLGRAFLQLGDWGGRWKRGGGGALVLGIHTTPALLVRSLADVPGWLFSNVVMVALLVVLTTAFAILEGVAVRSGRGIVRSIEEEVGSLREGATRFGAGDLGHRIPVRGGDELSALAGALNRMAESLERQRGELVEKERLDEDLEVALAIQRRFLPQRAPSVPGLDVAGVSVPSREVGGDLFHYLELPGGRLAVALGDVSGKSVPAALIMSNVMSALRTEVQHESEVERSLGRINRLLAEQIEPGRFVTLFYGIADPDAGRLRYTSAGHNPVLRMTAAGAHTWLREGGVPLGVRPDAEYPAAELPLERGDLIVAYSDGVTEAEGPEREGRIPHFGEERLAETVASLRGGTAEGIVAGILAAVRAFAEGRPQADDVTLVVVRRV